jgi:subtilisin family serine protease
MAGPHVVGVVALLWSARPALARNIAATKMLLQNTANPAVTVSPAQTCGGTTSSEIPNNSFGYGRVNALAAVNAVPTAAPARISGQIVSAAGPPVGGSTVTVSGGTFVIRAITDSNGSYSVDGLTVGVVYTVTPSRANYLFTPTDRVISLVGNKTDAVFTAEATVPEANPLESPEFFVRQQYLDFLDREPEQEGLDYWSGQLRACGADLNCVNTRRIGISAAFFVEQEFQLTGSYIYDVYAGTLGRKPSFGEYSSDQHQVVGGASLEVSKTAFAQTFVQRTEFTTKYQTNTTAASFVDALIQNLQAAAVDLSDERANLVGAYNNAGNIVDSRAAVVRMIADNALFKQSQYNQAFVLTEYFAYLRRDAEPDGYNFWLNVLNTRDPGNYQGMVCSFVTSAEYQLRFSSVVTHTNGECVP